MKPKIALTMGDPAGVGPEIVARVCHDQELRSICELNVVGRPMLLRAGAVACGLPEPQVPLIETGQGVQIKPGRPSAQGGALAGAFIEKALTMCLSGQADAMVTAPISKQALQEGGYPDTGHTSLLARLTGVKKPVMMLAGKRLKVVLATIHCSYCQVLNLLSSEGITQVGEIAAREVGRYFGIDKLRLAVAALNPHAGEGGIFGREEETIISPAIEKLRSFGIEASGPHPADTLFWRAAMGQFDLVLCMYHDQGLIPLKLLHFEDGVNVTLGLPVIRTSVDHGTAYDIAGQGKANPNSLKAAIKMAVEMVKNQSTA